VSSSPASTAGLFYDRPSALVWINRVKVAVGTAAPVQLGKIDSTIRAHARKTVIFSSYQVRKLGSVRQQQVDKNKDDLMPTQNPHRNVDLCTSSKVYNTLTELRHLESHRSAKFLSLLAENLVRKGLLNEHEVIHMLDLVVD
jgi:hypothetical protein